VVRLGRRLAFPPAEEAHESGLLAVGGDLGAERLLLAYASGIFPWYEAGGPILWHSPDPRFALRPGELHVPRSLAKSLRKPRFEIRLDTAFARVIRACAGARGPGRTGTWITPEMIEAYEALHALGFAHSAEAWQEGELVGGLYGVSLGAAFFGESMFALRADASKAAFVTLVRQLERWSFRLIDCQVETDHLVRFGATGWPRAQFLAELERALAAPTRRGTWSLDVRD
jgi:leucyl/phenylalanyl-tRNA--protein transferase